MKNSQSDFSIRFAKSEDTSLIFKFIQELASFEKLLHEVTTTETELKKTLFGEQKVAEVLIGEHQGKPVAFALFFHNFSTFLGKPGLYLEDLYVKPECRGLGFGLEMLAYLARLAKERGCGRFEWWVLKWNKDAIRFYERIGAKAMDEWTVYRMTGEELNKLAGET